MTLATNTSGQPISTRQVDPDLVKVQSAAASLHQRVQILEATRFYFSSLLVGAGVLVTLAGYSNGAVAIVGLAWSLTASGIVRPLARTQHRRAVVAQEMFDTKLFGIAWNNGLAAELVSVADIESLSRRLPQGSRRRSSILSGWYLDTQGVPHPYDVLLCQFESLAWDVRLRLRYGFLISSSLYIWLATGIVVGFVADVSVEQLIMAWYVPSLGAITLGIELLARQRSVRSDRERLLTAVSSRLSEAEIRISSREGETGELGRFVRETQDGIYLVRLETPRVPHILYLLFRSRDGRDFRALADTYRERLGVVEGSPT